jgi:hypothetical protein
MHVWVLCGMTSLFNIYLLCFWLSILCTVPTILLFVLLLQLTSCVACIFWINISITVRIACVNFYFVKGEWTNTESSRHLHNFICYASLA